MISKTNINVKLGKAQELADDISSKFSDLLETIVPNFHNQNKIREVFNEINNHQSKILKDIKHMNIADRKQISKYFTFIHEIIIEEYDKDRKEILKGSNGQNLLVQDYSDDKKQIDIIISSYSEK